MNPPDFSVDRPDAKRPAIPVALAAILGAVAAVVVPAWAIVVNGGFSSLAPSTAAAAVASPALAATTTVAAAMRRVDRVQVADGVIESSRQATVAAQVSGTVLRTLVDAGDRVRKGQLLAVIDPSEVSAGREAALAQVAAAESRAADARQAWERTRSLKERNFVSQAALDQAKTALDAADAGLRAARAGDALADVQQKHAQVLAPQDGVVAARLAEVGELAVPGRALFVVHQPGDLRIVATVPASLPLDARAPRITSATLPDGRVLQAGGVSLLPAADARDLSRRIRIALKDESALVPGMAVKVTFALEQVERLVVPASAVLWRGEMSAVRVQTADGRTLLRQVRLGERYADGWVEVLSGVTAGEMLVSNTANIGKAP